VISQNSEKLKVFLSRLGFNPQKDFLCSPQLSKIGVDVAYESKKDKKAIGAAAIYFKYLSESALDKDLPNLHRNIWNENKTEVFVVVSDNTTLLCASKYKPDQKTPRLCQIDSFDYGINTLGFEPAKLKPILKDLKENIDFGFFWEYIRERIKDRKRNSVDYDLLLNLIKLKNDLDSNLSRQKKYILIERCLFLKFLEDKDFLSPPSLLNILKSNGSQKLIDRFDAVNNILNGNIFDETIFIQQEISKDTITKLHDFFTTDYRNRQTKLFPYKFDIIPVDLLSNIYEAFLKAKEQASSGIYYTPSNLVDLVLSETLVPMLKKTPKPTCLDFACGSGIFLVKSFKKIVERNNCRADFEKKKNILKNCIWGVEKDPVATRITIFSLYLTLLDGENPEKTRSLIKNNKIKFPKLLNKNILNNDTLFDELNFVNEDGKKINMFDVVIGNPPWGVNLFTDIENNKKMKLPTKKQDVTIKTQSSQYFILKAKEFLKDNSVAGFISNNSNFLMSTAEPFRKQLLKDYMIRTIYELTHCNSILFNKRRIGELTLGADEPAVVVIFAKNGRNNKCDIKYISPSLDSLSKFLRMLVFKNSEIKHISQSLLLENDHLWRILAVGDMEDYRLIKKLQSQRELKTEGLVGFEAAGLNEKYKILKDSKYYADMRCVMPFVFLTDQIKGIPATGMKIREKSGGLYYDTGKFKNKKLLVKKFIEKDLRIRSVYDYVGYRFKNDLLGLLFDYDYRLILSLFNSSLVSYFLYFNSSQIGKGTYNMLYKNEIENVPIPMGNNIPNNYKKELINLTEKILEAGYTQPELVNRIDEIIFDIYHLKEFEKQRIRDFFNVRYRTGSSAFAKLEYLQEYVNRFRNVFSFILKEDRYLNAKGYISNSIGAGILFVLADIKDKKEKVELLNLHDIREFIAVNKLRVNDSQKRDILMQDKIKLYNEARFVIIKSNQFKDWTETEAIKDANEEIGEWLKQLPNE
jgi:hypothetical protein